MAPKMDPPKKMDLKTNLKIDAKIGAPKPSKKSVRPASSAPSRTARGGIKGGVGYLLLVTRNTGLYIYTP